MKKCEVDRIRLGSRQSEIAELLRPLSPPRRRVAVDFAERSPRLTFGAYTGPRLAVDVTEWRFATSVVGLAGSYCERWIPVDERKNVYYLERAYLQLHLQNELDRSEIQIVALHCDPNESDQSHDAKYKRGPHLHVSAAQHPISRSHFALNLSELDHVLNSFANLENAFELALRMLEDEVLALFKRGG